MSDNAHPPSIPAAKRYQQIATAISQGIASGRYRPGDRLPTERELSENFGVSRPTVREAMLALALQGQVEIRHGAGNFVAVALKKQTSPDPNIGDFELTEARILFEGEAAALAATTISDEQILDLEDVLAAMEAENSTDCRSEHADRLFHLKVAQATNNAAIVLVVEALWDLRDQSPLCRHMLDLARDVGIKPQVDAHRAIVEALKTHDPAIARQAMRSHLERVIEGLLIATESEALQKVKREAELKRDSYEKRRSVYAKA